MFILNYTTVTKKKLGQMNLHGNCLEEYVISYIAMINYTITSLCTAFSYYLYKFNICEV
jgi:hypothetical protein